MTILHFANRAVRDLGAHIAPGIVALAVDDEGTSIAALEGIHGCVQADQVPSVVGRGASPAEVHHLFGLELNYQA